MPRNYETRTKLRRGEPVIGTVTLMSDPWIVEIAGAAGMDFVIVDLEHTALDLSTVENLMRAADAADITGMVRVQELHRKTISRVMDSGAGGVLLPLVEDRATADSLRSFMAYPPRGTRTTCSMVRAADFGLARGSFQSYTDQANDESLAIVLVETMAGVRNIDEILDADIDVVLLGRSDLSMDMGLSYDVHNPRVIELCMDVIAKTKALPGRTAAVLAYSVTEAEEWLARGCEFVIYSQPELILANDLKEAMGRLSAVAREATPA